MRRMSSFILSLGLLGCAGEFDPDLEPPSEETGSTDGGSDEDSSSEDEEDDGETGSESGSGEVPASCGNGVADPDEECDGLDLRGADCTGLLSPGSGSFHGGQLACTDGCTFDTSSCLYCGDGARNGPEECDGSDVGGETCEDHDFVGGALTCTVDCQVSTDSCLGCDGDEEGMYGTPEDAECGGMTRTEGSATYTVCTPPCETSDDCADPSLEFCPVQPTCDNAKCYIVCSSDDDCPGGMVCELYATFNVCYWEL